ncbi:MAG TPA: methylated-DNA--[protein]-cysteine S-methyltransferase [Thermoanaerobaculia bacterium]|nr:methylated-DNA--[protein]-cysteine S-methyltransferase [Thermoanaerobaculia bacterium]
MPDLQGESAEQAQSAQELPPPLRVLIPSPIGHLGVELRGTVVTRLIIDPGKDERSGFKPFHKIEGSDTLDEIFGRLSEYFAGARRRIEIDFDLGSCALDTLSRRVLKETAKIPYGRTRTYQNLAEAVGRPEAYRQVSSILQENPIPVLIPCHRVVASKGLGSYVAGAGRKKWLLELESHPDEWDGDPL